MFTDTASSKVSAAHLSRTALLYVCQSTIRQVLHNTESAVRQYDLRGRAIALGWADDQIRVIGHRPGPVRGLGRGPGRVPAAGRRGVAGSGRDRARAGCSRLARNSADWHQLLELCVMTGTLICDEGGLYDPRTFNDRLLLGMKGPHLRHDARPRPRPAHR